YLKKPSADQLSAYHAFVDSFRAETQSQEFVPQKETDKKPPLPLDEVDTQGFMTAWSNLQDTHDFHSMLREYRISRTDALRVARTDFSWQMPLTVVRYMLELAANREVPIMVFVGNRGMIQIHSGPVRKIKMMGDWLNVLDPEFNLHLRQPGVAECWLVEKPTEDGPVHSLELYDADGATLVSFFGARKPGIPQREDWTQIVNELRPLEAV
ncbi:MAG: ChuX/HutX family heme-like substrate-binding protein, partial [Cyclonatronaceae bacterium]